MDFCCLVKTTSDDEDGIISACWLVRFSIVGQANGLLGSSYMSSHALPCRYIPVQLLNGGRRSSPALFRSPVSSPAAATGENNPSNPVCERRTCSVGPSPVSASLPVLLVQPWYLRGEAARRTGQNEMERDAIWVRHHFHFVKSLRPPTTENGNAESGNHMHACNILQVTLTSMVSAVWIGERCIFALVRLWYTSPPRA